MNFESIGKSEKEDIYTIMEAQDSEEETNDDLIKSKRKIF